MQKIMLLMMMMVKIVTCRPAALPPVNADDLKMGQNEY